MAIRKAGAEPPGELAAFVEPFSQGVRRTESKLALERYTTGLLSDIPRKTAAGMGRAMPGTNDQRLQEFLTNTAWEAGKVDSLHTTLFFPFTHRLSCVKFQQSSLTLIRS